MIGAFTLSVSEAIFTARMIFSTCSVLPEQRVGWVGVGERSGGGGDVLQKSDVILVVIVIGRH